MDNITMPRKLIALLTALIIISIVCYVFYLNGAPAEVVYKPGQTWQGPMALVLIVSFCIGVLSATLVALIFGIRMQFRFWRNDRHHQMLKDHRALIAKARGALALGNYEDASSLFKKIIDKDREDVTARVLLARSLQRGGKIREALVVLDQARAEERKNVELLLLAAELNEINGNHTAAYDNALMVLSITPKSPSALRRIVSAAENLGRLEEAVDFQSQLVKLVPVAERSVQLEELARLQLAYVSSQKLESVDARKVAIEDVPSPTSRLSTSPSLLWRTLNVSSSTLIARPNSGPEHFAAPTTRATLNEYRQCGSALISPQRPSLPFATPFSIKNQSTSYTLVRWCSL